MSFLQFFQTTAFLSLLIFLHELGHFLAGKFIGVRVEEFGIGYPPRLWGKRFGETIYSVNLVPFGGFCKFSREDFDVESKLRRALILVSGVLANFILGWFFISVLFVAGKPSFRGEVVVIEVQSGSPAESAGIFAGDTILSIAGIAVDHTDQLIGETQKRLGQEVALEVKTVGSEGVRLVSLVPRKESPPGEGAMGVSIKLSGEEILERTSVLEAPVRGFLESISILGDMVRGIGQMFWGLVFEHRVPRDLAGPVGVYHMTATVSRLGLRHLVQFVAFLSFNLFLLNLLPIPALDGGQLMFILIEALRRRRLSPRIEQWVNGFGMAFLVVVALLLTIQDIKRLF